MRTIHIREAYNNDICHIRQLAYTVWPLTYKNSLGEAQLYHLLSHMYSEEALQKQFIQGHQFLLAEETGLPIGFCSYELHYLSSRELMVHKLYVHPSHQGMGLGNRFLNILTEIAGLNNDHMIRLKVYNLNHRALQFYLSKGFKIFGTENTEWPGFSDISDYVMKKEI